MNSAVASHKSQLDAEVLLWSDDAFVRMLPFSKKFQSMGKNNRGIWIQGTNDTSIPTTVIWRRRSSGSLSLDDVSDISECSKVTSTIGKNSVHIVFE